jgi:hypothetical protein
LGFYTNACRQLIAASAEPIILVDWSDLKPDRRLLLLRTTLWTHRHALVLYEEIHPLRKQNSPQVERESAVPQVHAVGRRTPDHRHRRRLSRSMVCASATAGLALGGPGARTLVRVAPVRPLVAVQAVVCSGHGKSRALGIGQIVRARPVDCALFLYRKPPKDRSSKTLHGRRRRSNDSNKCANREREPWLLAAEMSLADRRAWEIVNIYRMRRANLSRAQVASVRLRFRGQPQPDSRVHRCAAVIWSRGFNLMAIENDVRCR